MKQSGAAIIGGKLFFTMVLPGLILLALMVSFPAFASAAGDPDGDAKITAMQSDLAACMQPGAAGQKAREAFAKKYNVPLSKLNEKAPNRPPAGNGGWDYDTSWWVCLAEMGTAVGAFVWAYRRDADKFRASNIQTYCVSYSTKCDHYHWRQDCLKEHEPACCN